MDNGDRESVGSVIGLRDGFESEMEADHLLDLGFMSVAVATNSVFDLIRGVFKNWKIALFGDQQTDAARFGDRNTSSDVLFEEKFFNRHDFRMIEFDDLMERIIDIFKTFGERSMRRGGDDAIVERFATFDNTETTDASTRVDAKNSIH